MQFIYFLFNSKKIEKENVKYLGKKSHGKTLQQLTGGPTGNVLVQTIFNSVCGM